MKTDLLAPPASPARKRNKFYRYKRERWQDNVVFGLAAIADGLVRVLSLGRMCSTFTLDVAREHARQMIQRTKERQQ